MRVKPYVYLFYILLLALGLAPGFLLARSGGVMLTLPIITPSRPDIFSPGAVLTLYCTLMQLPLLLFGAGFTLFAPFVAGAATLYLGALIGSGGLSSLFSAPQPLPVTLIAALLLALHIILCAQAASHRIALRTVAPGFHGMMRSRVTRAYIRCFLCHCTVTLGASALLVLLLTQTS